MEIIGAIILAHLVGDYLLQSHWMATQKTTQWLPAILHGICYTIPFIFVTQSVAALAVIGGTHILIDRFRIAKYLGWLKNQMAPKEHRYPWKPKPLPMPAGKFVYNPPEDSKDSVAVDLVRGTQESGVGVGEINAKGISFAYDNPDDAFIVRDTSKDNNPATGFPNYTPAWMSVWLMIILDNSIHLLINVGAVHWL